MDDLLSDNPFEYWESSDEDQDDDSDGQSVVERQPDLREGYYGWHDETSSESDSDEDLFVSQSEEDDMDDEDDEVEERPISEHDRHVMAILADTRLQLRMMNAANGDFNILGDRNMEPGGARATATQNAGRNNERESRRHHPYRPQQPQNNRNMNIDDELIEMEVAPLRRSRGPPNNRNNRRTPVLNREIIDLTGDPSSPSSPEVELHATSQIPHHLRGALGSRSNNPRRQNANLQRTPSLARSDGSLLGNGSRTIPIDLTIDDEPAPRQQPPPPPPNVPALPQHPIRHGADNPGGNFRAIFQNQFLDNFSDIRQHLNRTFGNLVNRQVHNFELDLLSIGGGPANPLGDNMPNLHYAVGLAGRRHESPRPKHVAPSPAPEGFTRNTGGDDLIVCAGCEEELQFCPEDEDAKRKAPPAKKARSRKDMEEHFFWALKDCGHVYCKTCYDKRSTKKGSPFVPSPDNNRKLTCAIPDCSTEVGTKYAWVGLFL